MALSNDKLMKELAEAADNDIVLLYKAIEDTPSRKVGWFSIPAKQPDDIKTTIKKLRGKLASA